MAFVSSLMESGVEFTAVDFPQANRLTVHILAAVAEHEAKMISDRTKAALAAAKARGTKLGRCQGEGNVMTGRIPLQGCCGAKGPGREPRRRPRPDHRRAARVRGHQPPRLAAGLNRAGIAPPRGTTWSPMAVRRTLARIGA